PSPRNAASSGKAAPSPSPQPERLSRQKPNTQNPALRTSKHSGAKQWETYVSSEFLTTDYTDNTDKQIWIFLYRCHPCNPWSSSHLRFANSADANSACVNAAQALRFVDPLE